MVMSALPSKADMCGAQRNWPREGCPPPEPSEVRADQQNRTCANDHGRTYHAARKYALRYIKLARRIRSRHVVGKTDRFRVKLDLAQCRMAPVAQVFEQELFNAAC